MLSLLDKSEDLSSDSRYPCKNQVWQHLPLIPEEERQEREMDPLSSLARQSNRTGKLQVQGEILFQKKKITCRVPEEGT